MGLTPDEIAHRAFTPSVDGYHQGEVRSFLERIALQLRGLQSSLPDGRVELAELTTALHDHEPRLAGLQDRLTAMLADLASATDQIQNAQRETSEQLALATELAQAGQTGDGGGTADQQQALLEQLRLEQQAMTAQLAAAQKLAAQQAEAAEHLATVGDKNIAQLEAAERLVAQQTEAAEHLAVAGDKSVAQLAAAHAAAQQIDSAASRATAASLAAEAAATAVRTAPAPLPTPAPAPAASPVASQPPATSDPLIAPAQPGVRPEVRRYTDPIDGAAFDAPPVAPPTSNYQAPTEPAQPSSTDAPGGADLSLFASDLDSQPLFSASANDLLDGVLDDVMENLNEDEGNPPS